MFPAGNDFFERKDKWPDSIIEELTIIPGLNIVEPIGKKEFTVDFSSFNFFSQSSIATGIAAREFIVATDTKKVCLIADKCSLNVQSTFF